VNECYTATRADQAHEHDLFGISWPAEASARQEPGVHDVKGSADVAKLTGKIGANATSCGRLDIQIHDVEVL
jgi:hypothetical protein